LYEKSGLAGFGIDDFRRDERADSILGDGGSGLDLPLTQLDQNAFMPDFFSSFHELIIISLVESCVGLL
jgi:hypothetical protein